MMLTKMIRNYIKNKIEINNWFESNSSFDIKSLIISIFSLSTAVEIVGI